MFKKILLAAVALSFIGAPLAQARDNQPQRKPAVHQSQAKKQPAKKGWSKGQRLSGSRHSEVKDYKRYGLRAPGRGQQWVKVDNQYLLITAATGLIAGVMAAR
ncbi:Ni/Co efflux regulator RcnB [Ochrobactrum sp. 19YEA23]|uniref:RcnB family protein n=1 Tax=Ochrobactrum sp. 19YEA23 TaxID=3039854 RepID=UPI00247B196C|nr:Ni/Co efflux regulator RcnB [Ochrobactrum sp. 19YEA23]